MAHDSSWSNDIAASLRSAGHETHLVDFATLAAGAMPTNRRDAERLLQFFSSVELVPRPRHPWLQHIALIGPLRRRIRAIRPDIVLCLYGGRFALAAFASGFRPYSVYVVGSDVLLAGRVQRLMNRFLLSSAAIVFANGNHLARRTQLQAPAARIQPLLIGVMTENLIRRPREPTPLIFSHRTFSATYDNATIIRALAVLPADVPPFRMVFASGGPDLEAAKQLAEALLPPHIRRHVEFWGGRALYADIIASLSKTDLYISMSLSDGMPTSVLEAMACGAFPILSDIPANRQLLEQVEHLGAFIPPSDHLALAHCIDRCLRNIDEQRALADAIQARILSIGDAKKTRRVLADELTRAVARRSH